MQRDVPLPDPNCCLHPWFAVSAVQVITNPMYAHLAPLWQLLSPLDTGQKKSLTTSLTIFLLQENRLIFLILQWISIYFFSYKIGKETPESLAQGRNCRLHSIVVVIAIYTMYFLTIFPTNTFYGGLFCFDIE